MKKTFRVLLAAGMLTALVAAVTLHAAAADPGDGNRLEASFTESAQSVTNRIADLGTLQLINTGSGTVDGFGSATVVVGITEDKSVSPCGAGSSSNAATRRIVLADGVLVLHELSTTCPTHGEPTINGTFQVDGNSSTGRFAGAWGDGELSVNSATHTAYVDGKLHLAG